MYIGGRLPVAVRLRQGTGTSSKNTGGRGKGGARYDKIVFGWARQVARSPPWGEGGEVFFGTKIVLLAKY